MRKLKKLLAVASVAAMTLSLCACGGKKGRYLSVSTA